MKLARGVRSPGSEVSLRDVLQDGDVKRLLGHELPQPPVLGLERIEPLDLLDADASVLLAPPVVALHADPDLSANCRRALTLGALDLDLPQLGDDLLSRVPLCSLAHLPRSAVGPGT